MFVYNVDLNQLELIGNLSVLVYMSVEAALGVIGVALVAPPPFNERPEKTSRADASAGALCAAYSCAEALVTGLSSPPPLARLIE